MRRPAPQLQAAEVEGALAQGVVVGVQVTVPQGERQLPRGRGPDGERPRRPAPQRMWERCGGIGGGDARGSRGPRRAAGHELLVPDRGQRREQGSMQPVTSQVIQGSRPPMGAAGDRGYVPGWRLNCGGWVGWSSMGTRQVNIE